MNFVVIPEMGGKEKGSKGGPWTRVRTWGRKRDRWRNPPNENISHILRTYWERTLNCKVGEKTEVQGGSGARAVRWDTAEGVGRGLGKGDTNINQVSVENTKMVLFKTTKKRGKWRGEGDVGGKKKRGRW